MEIVDCDQRGLILKNGTVVLWEEMEVIGKYKVPGSKTSFYYLKKLKSATNTRIDFVDNPRDLDHIKKIKLRVIEHAKKLPMCGLWLKIIILEGFARGM